jgi:hypothetical protein
MIPNGILAKQCSEPEAQKVNGTDWLEGRSRDRPGVISRQDLGLAGLRGPLRVLVADREPELRMTAAAVDPGR